MITRDAPKLGWFAKSLLGLAVLFPLCICGLFFGWPTGGGKEASKKSSCQSNLKQIISGAQIYASDNNDAMPPFYSFEGTEPATRFRGALNPYLKSDEVYLCLLDDTVWGPGDERGQMRFLERCSVVPVAERREPLRAIARGSFTLGRRRCDIEPSRRNRVT